MFISDDCNAIDQPFNVIESNLNVKMISQHCIFLLVKSQNDDNSALIIHSLPAQQAVTLTYDDISTGNAFSLTHYTADLDEIEFNYHGPKLIPQHETPVTICMANTKGAVLSRWLFRVLFDSGSNVCMIKKSALPLT